MNTADQTSLSLSLFHTHIHVYTPVVTQTAWRGAWAGRRRVRIMINASIAIDTEPSRGTEDT